MNNNSINRRRWHKENTSVTLNVENFPHWVWIWGVEENAIPNHDRVFFTGDNIYIGVDGDLWPWRYSIGGNEIRSYLPWRSGPSYKKIPGDPKEKAEYFISSTEMVWKWKQYEPDKAEIISGKWVYTYDWTSNLYPWIYTRYYDGSH